MTAWWTPRPGGDRRRGSNLRTFRCSHEVGPAAYHAPDYLVRADILPMSLLPALGTGYSLVSKRGTPVSGWPIASPEGDFLSVE